MTSDATHGGHRAERSLAVALAPADGDSRWLPELLTNLERAGYRRSRLVELREDEPLGGLAPEEFDAVLLRVGDTRGATAAVALGRAGATVVYIDERERDASDCPADVVTPTTQPARLRHRIEATIDLATSGAPSWTADELFRAAFESSPVAMLLSVGLWTDVAVNAAFLDLLGYDRDQLSELGIAGITHPDDYAEDARLLGELLLGRRDSYEMDKRYRHGDGGEVWGRLTVRRLEAGERSRPAFLAVLQDVRQHKQTESALRDAEVLLQQMIDAMPVVFWALTPDWKQVVYISSAWEQVYGVPCDALRANPALWVEMMHPEDREGAIANAQRTHDRPSTQEYRIIDADGNVHWIRDSAFPVFDGRGEIVLIAGYGEDITEHKLDEVQRQEVDAQLMRAQKLQSLGLLAGGVAHDFNNLLTVVMANASLVGLRGGVDDAAKKSLDEIQRAAHRAADLCQQMLAFAGKSPRTDELVDLSALVEEMSSMLEVSTAPNTALELDLGPETTPITGDATQLRQLVMNLILNAAEAIGDAPGTISVSTSVGAIDHKDLRNSFVAEAKREQPHVLLDVRDTGCGIDDDTLELMFDPFFTTKLAGRGLGLAAVLGIVRAHEGAVAVTRVPRGGTTFRVYLPKAHDQRIAVDTDPDTAREWQGSGTILLIDDQQPVLHATRRVLESLGFDVVIATGGENAIAALHRHQTIDCVLCDLTMPDMDGVQTSRALREIDGNLPIILASGYSEQRLDRAAEQAHASGTLHKPYDLDALTRVLRDVLG